MRISQRFGFFAYEEKWGGFCCNKPISVLRQGSQEHHHSTHAVLDIDEAMVAEQATEFVAEPRKATATHHGGEEKYVLETPTQQPR